MVVMLMVAVAVKVAVVIRVVAARATKEERERLMGEDVGRSAQRSSPQKKKPSGTPLTLRWLLLHRES